MRALLRALLSARQAGSLNFILNTVTAPLDLDLYVQLLRRDGTMTLVGAPREKAYERMLKSDVKYRFVIDMASLR